MVKRRLLCPKLPTSSAPVILSSEEARHARKVLRLRNGDLVEALDGQGHKTLARLSSQGDQTCLEWVNEEGGDSPSTLAQKPEMNDLLPLHLEISILKGDAMEWVIEKAVELGVHSLTPLVTDHTVVQVQAKGEEYFKQRWQKIADQALKQCGRLKRLEIYSPQPFKGWLKSQQKSSEGMIRFWCDESGLQEAPFLGSWALMHQEHLRSSGVHLLIGPEGGWSRAEKEQLRLLSEASGDFSWVRVHLGPSILRAETAALSSVSLLSALIRAQVSEGDGT